jgi:hypothetical protein
MRIMYHLNGVFKVIMTMALSVHGKPNDLLESMWMSHENE